MSAEGIGVKVVRGVIYALALLFLAFLVLLIASKYVWIILLPFHLICGWYIHGSKALPHLFGKWQEAIFPIGCLLMAAVIAHRFVRRWVGEKFPDRTWSIRRTAAVLSLLLLGSAAAIAASGVVHQMFWLAGGKVIYDNRKSEFIVAMSNGRQLMLALQGFQAEEGRYPASFEELEIHAAEYPGMTRRLSWLDSRDREVPEPWILLRPGSSEVALEDEPVIVSPVIASGSFVMVGYGDSTIRPIRLENLQGVLGQNGRSESEGGR
jgi:hypothetical protein